MLSGVSILDIAVLALLLISFIAGLVRGLQKSIDGMFGLKLMVLAALFTAYFAISGLGTAVSPIANLDVFRSLSSTVESTLVNNNEVFGLPASYSSGVLKVEKDGAILTVTEALAGGLGVGTSFIDTAVSILVPEDSYSSGQTLANYFASKAVQVVCIFVLFLVLCIVNRIVLGVISNKLKERLKDNQPLKRLDRVLGAVAHISSSLFNVIVAFYIMSLLVQSGSMNGLDTLIEQSAVAEFILALFA